MKNPVVQQITRTALLIALCAVLQLSFPVIQLVKGPAVNVVLLVAAYSVSLPYAIAVAVINPILVFIMAAPAVMLLCPQIMFVVMLGNVALVLCAGLLKKPVLGIPGLVAAVLAKTAVMTLTITYLVLPVFGGGLAEAQVAAAQSAFGLAQFSTAAIGCAIFWVCWQVLKKIPAFSGK